MSKKGKAVAIVAVLVPSLFLVVPFSAPLSAQGGGKQMFGFGDSGLSPNNWVTRGYTCMSFYNGIFMTPPYPSVYVWQLGTTDEWNQTGGTTQTFLDCVASRLSANQYMVYLFGLNTGKGCCVYDPNALIQFEQYARALALKSYATNLYVGLDGEHSQGMPVADFNSMVSYITSPSPQGLGMKNANRYLGSNHNPYLTPINDLQTSNWPFANDYGTVATPSGGGYIGSFVGVIDGAPYPFAGCGPAYGYQSDYAGLPGWTDNPVEQGYVGSAANSQACAQNWPYNGASVGTIQDLLAQNAGNPNARIVAYVNNWVCPGWPPQRSGGTVCFSPLFTGASGVQTNYQIDDPQFRNTVWQWIEAHSGVYELGTSNTSTTSTTTTTSSSVASSRSTSTIGSFTSTYTFSGTSTTTSISRGTSVVVSSSASNYSQSTTESTSSSSNRTIGVSTPYLVIVAIAALVFVGLWLKGNWRSLIRFGSKS